MPLQLLQDCIKKWRLEELDQLIIDFNDYVAEAIRSAKIEFSRNYTSIVLSTAGKSLLTMREILYLSAAGYPDGALSLSRNLYEQFIILTFFENKKEHESFGQLVKDYFLDYEIQNLKEHKFALESTNASEELLDLERRLEELKNSTHSKTNGDYWWTGKSSFFKLAEYVLSKENDEVFCRFLKLLHVAYKRACTSLHASCLGNILRLKDDSEPYIVDILQTNDRQYFPLWFATSSLILVCGVTCKTLGIGLEPYISKLNEFALFYQTSYDRSNSND